jgi:photosystem II stability/assembly factor-like uncharacterized protein
MDTIARDAQRSRTSTGGHLTLRLPLLLVAGLVLILLCPGLAAAAGSPSHRGLDDWFNGVDVVGGWGWSVGTNGLVEHWAVGGTARDVRSLGASDDIQAIDMVTAKIGYVVTAAKQQGAKAAVYKTTDGGRTWKRKLTAAVDLLAAVKFRSATLGWVAGRGGTVLKTSNGGKTWAKLKTNTTETLYSLSFPSDKVGYAVGSGGVLITTTNAGKTWSKQDSWTAEALYGVDFVSAKVGWIVGGDTAGYCAATTDGGKRWYAKGASLPPLVAVDFVNATTGWVLGNEGAWPSISGMIFKVTGGGATWTDQSLTVDPSPPNYGLVALKAVDATHAYAEGESEASLYTYDGAVWHLGHIGGF